MSASGKLEWGRLPPLQRGHFGVTAGVVGGVGDGCDIDSGEQEQLPVTLLPGWLGSSTAQARQLTPVEVRALITSDCVVTAPRSS